jgi:leucyl aminopeptidase
VPFTRKTPDHAIPLQPVLADEFSSWMDNANPRHRAWLQSSGFKAKPGKWCAVPGDDGRAEAVVFGMQNEGWIGQLARLAEGLPEGSYQLVSNWDEEQRLQAGLGWGLAQYRFDRYRKKPRCPADLCLDGDIAEAVERLCAAQCLVRDLVNTPTEDLGPAQLVDALVAEADRFEAEFRVVSGEHLLDENFPAIHAVGRAADQAPRFASLTWGEEEHPLLVLAGKGVCFDSGGLDIKSNNSYQCG